MDIVKIQKMKFFLFSKISFEVSNPIALIEAYCFQGDFYANYDLLNDRTIEDVGKIGARIGKDPIRKCKTIVGRTKDLKVFKYDLDHFLNLTEKTRNKLIKELNERVIRRMLMVKGIGLSKTTKVLHTLYPKIIPMIDKQLQEEYMGKINSGWKEEQPYQILVDYYKNFSKGHNWKNLNRLSEHFLKHNINGLTKVRIFDILWWSYLKAEKLRERESIQWSAIK